ncbi:MAG: DEAD/DEAH box helicase [Candidatus Tectomicrobia bacterium]|uniref:DNA 3'-5' helicase n=1 Tax=Tectimicrobiota bacterium TaxID=2528274 RepID=A0A932CN86_UNCTE|nr:DEAD/DEAH box helicase [Candidatus Tectomicrobia bacterium]
MQNPLIIQSDHTVLLEVESPLYETVRDGLIGFAELVKSPEHIHTYRITPLSLWNAASAGLSAERITEFLSTYTKYEIPPNVLYSIRDYTSRYGRLKLLKEDGNRLLLFSEDPTSILEVLHQRSVTPFLRRQIGPNHIEIVPERRGHLKQALIKVGMPVEDLAGYIEGSPLAFQLQGVARSGLPFRLRAYQQAAAEVFHAGGRSSGGSGIIVLPCGAGKTIVGMAVMEKVGAYTLVLSTNISALRQWRTELLDKTDLSEELIGEYSGDQKEIRPITLTTYQILTYRKNKQAEFLHFRLFNEQDWGLIVYDEVHLLPAPVFRVAAEVQSRRRLGLTATLVREDGREDDVFSLIGPKKLDIPWKELEKQGWIAEAHCQEIRVPMDHDARLEYVTAPPREKYRVAATNPRKLPVIERLLARHWNDNVLVIGQYIEQLESIARELGCPIITGKTPQRERELLYDRFRRGEIKVLIVSKVANFAIDLPDANVAIQISGTFGSRQEEAQRLGRILRPKAGENQARFYTIVSRDTQDQDYALNRQLFLTEQGYEYEIAQDG